MADEIAMVEQLNRTERRLDALEQRVAQVQTDLREFAHAVKVQFEHVHHRFDVVDEQFQSLTEHMDRRFGYADFYYRVRHLYWAIDEWKYWTMGWPVAETVVVNRARVDAAEPWNTAPKA